MCVYSNCIVPWGPSEISQCQVSHTYHEASNIVDLCTDPQIIEETSITMRDCCETLGLVILPFVEPIGMRGHVST